jgi:hypothetical protein
MLVLRFIGALFLLGAVIALTADLSRTSRPPQAPVFTSLLKHWSDFAPQSLKAAQTSVQTRMHPVLWDPVILSLLSLPAWISLTVLAILSFWAGRPRRRVEIFVN